MIRELFTTVNHAGITMYRANDPATSREAAQKIERHLSELQMDVLAAFQVLGPMTAKECEQLKEFAHLAPSSCRKRVSELWHAGILRVCGRRDGCLTYEVVP